MARLSEIFEFLLDEQDPPEVTLTDEQRVELCFRMNELFRAMARHCNVDVESLLAHLATYGDEDPEFGEETDRAFADMKAYLAEELGIQNLPDPDEVTPWNLVGWGGEEIERLELIACHSNDAGEIRGAFRRMIELARNTRESEH